MLSIGPKGCTGDGGWDSMVFLIFHIDFLFRLIVSVEEEEGRKVEVCLGMGAWRSVPSFSKYADEFFSVRFDFVVHDC